MNLKPSLMLAAIVTTGLAGCGGGSSSSSNPSSAPSAAAAVRLAAAPPSHRLTVTASEYSFSPAALKAKAGKVRITLRNRGKTVHELVVLKTHQHAAALKVTNGRVPEKDSVGEVSETPPGKTKTSTLDLTPGAYVVVCNIPGHYQMDMRATLTVS